MKIFMMSSQETTRLPVHSAVFEQRTGELVARWKTTSACLLLYVFWRLFLHVFAQSDS
jgi:hypothetical protein